MVVSGCQWLSVVPLMVCSALKECSRSHESLRHPNEPDLLGHHQTRSASSLHRLSSCRLVEVSCFPLPRFLLSRQMR